VEGVVAKRRDHGYQPDKPWSKIRVRNSYEAVIGGVIGPANAPTALVLGRYNERGRLRVIGRTHRLPRAASAEVAAMLTPPAGPHPWPTVIPGGRVGLPGSEPVHHTPVAPRIVVEIEVDSAYEAGRFRHGVRFLRRVPRLPG